MSTQEKNGGKTLDEAVRAVRETEPTAAAVSAAGDRVWQRLTAASATEVVNEHEVVSECDGFLGMIAGYRRNELSEARRELFEDHIQNCLTCRRALWSRGKDSATRPQLAGWKSWRRWAAAAAFVVLSAVAVQIGVLDRVLLSSEHARTTAESVEGTLFRIAAGQLHPIAAGEVVDASDPIRTGRGTRAALRLADGSRVEMNEHSELTVRPRRDGIAVALRRGDVIVEAATQRPGRHLYVDAPDCQVAVKGTVFAVSHGPKGSRVSVLEGEVWVEHSGEITKLAPGEQTVTQASITSVPVAQEFSWSSDPERYAALLHEITEVGRQVATQLATVPVRHSSRLLPLAAADTFLYAAAPNITGELASAGEDLLRRIENNPELAAWFDQHRAQSPNAPDMFEALRRFRNLGSYLGDELVLAAAGDGADGHPGILVLAEVDDEAGLRAALLDEVQRISSQCGEELPVVVVDSASALTPSPVNALYVLVTSGVAAASDDAAALAALASRLSSATSMFTPTPFYSQLARCYDEGVTWLLATDVERLRASSAAPMGSGTEEAIATDLGLLDLRYLIVDHRRIDSNSQVRGILAFSQQRRGVADWLGSPASMGALEFVSPDAYAVGCLLSKRPRQIADEVISVLQSRDPQGFGSLTDFEREHGLSISEDLAAPLGGELLIAIDGPVLPKPAWKLVVLIEDQGRLQHSIEKIVAELNTKLLAEGRPLLSLTTTNEDGAQYTSLASADGALAFEYTFWDGYWLVAGDRTVLKDSMRTKRSGMTLANSAAFREALPADGQQQYSALAFVNASTLTAALAQAIPNTSTPEAQTGLTELKALLTGAPAMAFCVTAERDRILLTSTGIDLENPAALLAALTRMKGTAPGPAHVRGGGTPYSS